ncbi:MAG: hypothetical protein OXF02_05635 [Simkaniaceae bacterium]|nr:hypothetical protein [Simkaniaceae bacterium]
MQWPPRGCEGIPDEVVRDEELADEMIGENETDRVDILTVGALKRSEVETSKTVVRIDPLFLQSVRENLN